jgi:hypothetical protein
MCSIDSFLAPNKVRDFFHNKFYDILSTLLISGLLSYAKKVDNVGEKIKDAHRKNFTNAIMPLLGTNNLFKGKHFSLSLSEYLLLFTCFVSDVPAVLTAVAEGIVCDSVIKACGSIYVNMLNAVLNGNSESKFAPIPAQTWEGEWWF